VTKETLPRPDECTSSELILVVDEAKAGIVYQDHLEDSIIDAAWYALTGKGEKSPYISELQSRVYGWQWSKDQVESYTRNELMLTRRLKWGYIDALAWQK
jgi:hypothetical protein